MSDTDFGHEKVSFEEKKAKVNQVFDKVSPYYDLMNDLMSCGLHRLWKKWFTDKVELKSQYSVLDLACGSGDITLSLLKKEKDLKITLADPSEKMLNQAAVKCSYIGALGKNAQPQCTFQQVWAEDMSVFETNSFDVVVCSFGFRNMTHKDKALQEIYRVLKPSGFVHILEFSQVHGLAQKPYEIYRDKLLPLIGTVVGDQKSYEYLAESIDVFWDKQTFTEHLSQTGFEKIGHEAYSQGICLHTQAQKPSLA